MKIINIIYVILYCVIIDYPNIAMLSAKMYQDNFKKITKEDFKVKWIPAALAYITMSISINYFILNKFNNSSPTKDILITASILGFCIYGVYNFTNQATLNNYSTQVTIKDTIWGSTLYPLVSYLMIKVFPKI